jgi:arylsulfatase A-like enzyme
MKGAFLSLLAISFLASPALAQTKSSKPNVLIVLTDDQGLGDFSCMGNPILKTPNLDKFHRQAIRFTDFHVAPMCTPTRGQLMSGRDAVRNGATSVTGGRAFMRTGIYTLPQLMRMAGYRTGIFGKWHLGDNYPHRPMDRGYDEAMYHLGWGMTAAPEFVGKYMDGRYFHNGVEKHFKGYMTDLWFNQAMHWMKERKDKGEPFFCYLPTNAPHAPHIAPDQYIAPYKGGKAAGFFGMIANIDENFGKLEAFLKANGMFEDTIVIFMTDNGGTAGVPVFNAGMRGSKTMFYEGGHRTPCWVRWPAGKLREPVDVDVPTQVQDVLPTVLEFAEVTPPANYKFDGQSLAGVLRGNRKLPDRMMVVQYSRAELKKYECCVIWNQWRLVHGKELYDVHADRAQKSDVASKHPEIAKKMLDHYETWWKELEPLSGKFVATTLGSSVQPRVVLTSSDWQDIYADNAGHVSQAIGGPHGGPWNVKVEAAGEYEIHLRRWPQELDMALTDAPDRKDAKVVPVAAAKLRILGKEFSGRATSSDAKEIVIRASLPEGTGQLQAWFQNAQGEDLCGAFYATVVKK